jgi:hypothetical protein
VGGSSASSEFSADVRLLIAVVSGPVPPPGLSRFVSEHSRSPSRPPPRNWLGIASMRTLMKLVRTTRPSRLSVIGCSFRLRTWQEFGRLGSACEVVATDRSGRSFGPAPVAAAGMTTPLRLTCLVLPFFLIVPFSVPTATSLSLRVVKRSMV